MSNMNQLHCVPSAAPANNSNMIYSLQPVSMAAPAMAAPTDLNKNTPNPHMLQNAQMLVPAASQATHFMTPTNVPLGPLAQIPTPPSPHVLPEAQLHDPNVLYLYPQRPVGNQLPPQTPPQLHGSQSPFAGTAFLTPHCPSEGMMANGTPILPSCVSIPPSFHGGSSFPMPSTLLGPSAAMLHHQPTTPAVSSDVYMYNFPAGNLNTRMESTPPQPFYVFEGRTPSTMVSPFTPPALNPVPFGAHQQHHHAQARNSTVSSKRGSHGNNSMVGINPSRSWTNHVEEGKSYDQDPVPIDTTKKQLIVNFLPQRLTNEEFLSLFRPYGELDEAASHIIYDLRHANSQSKSTPHEGGSYAEDASGADNSSGICTCSSTSDPALPGLLNAASVTLTPKANPSGMRSKSYGFIYYKDGASTEAAIKELNGREVHNRRIKVRYANQQRSAMDMVPEAPPMESQKAREAAAIAQSRETTA